MSVFPKEVRQNDHAGKYYSFLHQIQRKSEDGRSDSGESAEGRRPGGVDRKSEEQIQNDAQALH